MKNNKIIKLTKKQILDKFQDYFYQLSHEALLDKLMEFYEDTPLTDLTDYYVELFNPQKVINLPMEEKVNLKMDNMIAALKKLTIKK